MATDYCIEVHRKCDNKIIAKFIANHLKTIMDSEFSEKINCNGRSINNAVFTVNDLETVISLASSRLSECYEKIFTNRIMLLNTDKKAAREEIKDDISYLEENIKDNMSVIQSASILTGMIQEVVEDDIDISADKNDDDEFMSAYRYNGMDLPKKQCEYANGEKYESSVYIFNDDAYCKIIAC